MGFLLLLESKCKVKGSVYQLHLTVSNIQTPERRSGFTFALTPLKSYVCHFALLQ